MSSIPPPPTPPPPPPPWNDPTPQPQPEPSPNDPTPVLSKIGMFNLPIWGNEQTQLVRLQGMAISWTLQWFATLAVAAALPWALGKPGVVWSIALIVIQMGSSYLGSRFYKKREVKIRVMIVKANRTQALIRMTLWLAIMTAWATGVARALGVSAVWVAYGGFLGVIIIVGAIRKARKDGQVHEAGDAPRPGQQSTSNGGLEVDS